MGTTEIGSIAPIVCEAAGTNHACLSADVSNGVTATPIIEAMNICGNNANLQDFSEALLTLPSWMQQVITKGVIHISLIVMNGNLTFNDKVTIDSINQTGNL